MHFLLFVETGIDMDDTRMTMTSIILNAAEGAMIFDSNMPGLEIRSKLVAS
jgi:hypothetical protein